MINNVQVQTLLKAQQSAKDGVIKLNSDTFSKYVKGKQRPFSLFMFLTASHLKSQTGNGLEDMRKDFGYLGKALKDKIAKGEISPGKVFLAEADFIDSQEVCPSTSLSLYITDYTFDMLTAIWR